MKSIVKVQMCNDKDKHGSESGGDNHGEGSTGGCGIDIDGVIGGVGILMLAESGVNLTVAAMTVVMLAIV